MDSRSAITWSEAIAETREAGANKTNEANARDLDAARKEAAEARAALLTLSRDPTAASLLGKCWMRDRNAR